MIETIYIKNFILIEELSLNFKDGFSVFTGETGAGKSIVMDAIGLLCGERVNSAMIRTGTEQSIVEGVFTLNESQKIMLEEAGIDNQLLIVTREFDTTGKNICRVNQRTVTLAFLKNLVGPYVDIHSQHDNQYLLNQKFHLSLLDSFCEIPELLSKLSSSYGKYNEIRAHLKQLEEVTFSEAQFELLQHQISEITTAKLQPNEDKELEDRIKFMSSYEKVVSRMNTATSLLDNDNGILVQIQECNNQLKQLNDINEIEGISEKIQNAYYELDDAKELINDYLSGVNVDENELNLANERIYEINRLKRKYGNTIEDILKTLSDLEVQHDQLNNRTEAIEKVKMELDSAFSVFSSVALEVQTIRKKKAIILESSVLEQLSDLQLENARFSIQFEEKSENSTGIDDVTFLISMNPGESLKPLQKVASGGELSRLMLGLKTIFSSLQGVELVIFDEIDTGVSGSVALSIGHKMQEVANKSQVFSVTHLAQVAACSSHHYKVSKQQSENSTITSLSLLEEDSRIEELAVISSGVISDASLHAAKELFYRVNNIWRVE